MLRLITNFLLPIFCLVVNSTVFENIKLHGVRPDLFIIVVICASVLRNDIEGAILGFLCGLVRDIFFSNTIGFFALLYMLVGYLCGKPFKYFYRENYFVPMILCFVATIFFESSVFILKFFSHNLLFYSLSAIVFPQALYNTVLILILYPLLYLLNKFIESYEIKRRKFF